MFSIHCQRYINGQSKAAASNFYFNSAFFKILGELKYVFFLFVTGQSLSCYRCGSLNANARKIEDCQGPNTVEECAPNEACVVFKRLYKKGSGNLHISASFWIISKHKAKNVQKILWLNSNLLNTVGPFLKITVGNFLACGF